MTRWIAGGVLIVLVSGCAAQTSRVGVYPMQGQDLTKQGEDTIACREAAETMAGSKGAEATTGAVTGVAAGAVVGAILGAIAGAFLGVPGEGAAMGAALGGATGGLSGLGRGAETNDNVRAANFRGCMTARGYAVGG